MTKIGRGGPEVGTKMERLERRVSQPCKDGRHGACFMIDCTCKCEHVDIEKPLDNFSTGCVK